MKFSVTSIDVPGFQGANANSPMKTLPTFAIPAALVAFLVLPIRFEIAFAMLSAAGFISIVVSDYVRRMRPLRVPAAVPVLRRERFGLAA
jgi:hypothetical protein